ncbi:MAG: hypothetical protein ACFUZC_20820 [Chthoniobacteraceae bacterium]
MNPSVLSFPRNVPPAEALSSLTLDRLTSYLFSWQQGAGVYGGLHLHSCWGETSVIKRHYHGQTTFQCTAWMRGMMRLFERTGDPFWRAQAADFVANLLYLCRGGGFIHASNEFEPTYSNMQTCPIHQGMPLLAMMDYYEWEHAEPFLKERIGPAIDAHWDWFQEHFWKRGNWGGESQISHAGWCGVTNQDIVIIAALARQARIFGKTERYEAFGKPALDALISPMFYHESLGLFRRGDFNRHDFVERTFYYGIILNAFQAAYDSTGDSRLSAVIENVSSHLFDAAFIAEDGRTHLSWGADVENGILKGWVRGPVPIPSYPVLLPWMRKYLAAHPDAEKQRIYDGIETTLAGYVFADGTIPAAVKTPDAIFAAVPNSELVHFWAFLIDHLGDSVEAVRRDRFVSVIRSAGDLVWQSTPDYWRLFRSDKPAYSGFKPDISGIVDGEGPLPHGDVFAWHEPECRETVEILPA